MKTGIILYIAGDDAENDFVEYAIDNLDIEADRVEVVSANSGHFDISDAWWFLTIKGMQRIVCMAAESTGFGTLKLTGRQLRLCG